MKAITKIQGRVIPLDKTDVDTDLIIPAQYLTSTSVSGYGAHLFQRLRDNDPNFVFNLPRYEGANILLADNNFGCGSSREHAVWALVEAGIEAIIAPSFADIFANNAGKNGLLLIEQAELQVRDWLNRAIAEELNLEIGVPQQVIYDGEKQFEFSMDPFTHYCFINGLDELDYLYSSLDQIRQFKEKQTLFLETEQES